jgi:hypothetical protein
MNILLIDADSTIPNIPLMKLSAWHKEKGDSVSLMRAKIPYYPNRKKKPFVIPPLFDKVYCSVIFQGNKDFIFTKYYNEKDVFMGGTGVDLTTNLPDEIENLKPDYSIYPENDTSYGFITRGCIRNCPFCVVPKKEGYIHKVADIDDIVQHKKVKFLDNNILSYPKHKEILKELVDKGIKCQFNQGLDIRLLDKENSELLSKMNYMGKYLFAFDSWSYKKIIKEKVKLLKWAKKWMIKFYVYISPSMPIEETIKRIMWLKSNGYLPYIMRDISCWNSKYSDFYTDISAYCNQPNFFCKLKFEDWLEIRHTNKNRIMFSKNVWEKQN